MGIQRLDGVQWNDDKGKPQSVAPQEETFVNSSFGDGFGDTDIPTQEGQTEITMVPNDPIDDEGVIVIGHSPKKITAGKVLKDTALGMIPLYNEFAFACKIRGAYNTLTHAKSQKDENTIIRTKPILDKYGGIKGYEQTTFDAQNKKKILSKDILTKDNKLQKNITYNYNPETGELEGSLETEFNTQFNKPTLIKDLDANGNTLSYTEIEYNPDTGLMASEHTVDNGKGKDKTTKYTHVLKNETNEDEYEDTSYETDKNGKEYWLIPIKSDAIE